MQECPFCGNKATIVDDYHIKFCTINMESVKYQGWFCPKCQVLPKLFTSRQGIEKKYVKKE